MTSHRTRRRACEPTNRCEQRGSPVGSRKTRSARLACSPLHVVYTSRIVFDETVTQGLALNAADASLLKESFDNGVLAITAVQSSNALLDEPIKIHGGERESIQLAIQLRASEFLIDDSRARKVAEQNFSTRKLSTVIRGTVGIIYLSFQNGLLSQAQAIQLLESIKIRRDIWISAKLCDRVLQLIRTG